MNTIKNGVCHYFGESDEITEKNNIKVKIFSKIDYVKQVTMKITRTIKRNYLGIMEDPSLVIFQQ